MFEPFQKFVPRAASRYGIAKEITACEVCHSFQKLIPSLFPKISDPLSHISPAHYKNSTLTINVESAAFGQEVIMRKDRIIEEMNAKAGKKIIENLKTQLKKQENS